MILDNHVNEGRINGVSGASMRRLAGAALPEASSGEFLIVGASLADGTQVQIAVVADKLIARQGNQVFAGAALEGMTMWMTHDNEVFELVLDKVYLQTLAFWEGTRELVPAYQIMARCVWPPDKVSDFAYVCRSDELDPPWGGIPRAAILFEGDHFDFVQQTVSDPPTPGLFNLACAGGAMAKMHLSRHTRASNHDGQFATTPGQRTTLLKMLEGDYCGTGQSFAVDDFPVAWLDSSGWSQPPLDLDPAHGQVTSIEAIWGPSGAVCLDTPRMYALGEIPCSLLPCNIAGWQQQGHVISANPTRP